MMLAHSLFSIGTNSRCSRKLASRIPPPLCRPRCTRGALLSHEFCVDVENPRLARCVASFFPATYVLWHFLPSSIFPPVFNLPLFKDSVGAHLRVVRFFCFFLRTPPLTGRALFKEGAHTHGENSFKHTHLTHNPQVGADGSLKEWKIKYTD